MTRLAPSLIACTLLVACGGDGGGDDGSDPSLSFPFACETPDATGDEAGLCRVYDEDGSTLSADEVANECDYLGGTVVSDCPADGVVGTCLTDQGSGVLVEYVYDEAMFTVDEAREHCETRNSCVNACTFREA